MDMYLISYYLAHLNHFAAKMGKAGLSHFLCRISVGRACLKGTIIIGDSLAKIEHPQQLEWENSSSSSAVILPSSFRRCTAIDL